MVVEEAHSADVHSGLACRAGILACGCALVPALVRHLASSACRRLPACDA